MAFVNLLQIIYPVGACYFSVNSTSPANLIGGTWAKMTGGMLGLAGSTGVAGASSNGGSRKISVNQMPSHNHTGRHLWTKNGGDSQLAWGNAGFSLNFDATLTTNSVGGGRDYIPAHTAVNGWRRTA